jgi:hypothetical protein
MSTQPSRARPGNGRILATAIAAAIAASYAAPASAVPIQTENWSGSWDTTVSLGGLWRVESPDCRLIANANGGCGRSANGDDGNLNYGNGLVSNVLKATTELELRYRDSWGLFARATGFTDWEVGDTLRTPLTSDAEDLVEQDVKMLDYFVFVPFDLGSMPAEFRVGNQVINWGESTFIPGGISVTNPIDLTQFRLPGAELREALVPQGMASLSFSPTLNTSVEAYYQYDWEKVKVEPAGSYFSTNDFASRGGTHVMLGFGAWGDQGTDFTPLGGSFDPDFNFVPRADNQRPDDGGQYGLAFRYFAEDLMGGMEFGFYYIRYHSRLPLISGRTGSQAGLANALAVAAASQAVAAGLASGLSFDAAVDAATLQALAVAGPAGADISEAKVRDRATVAGNVFLASPAMLSGLASSFASDELAQTSRYFVNYPEDLDLWGFSWSGYLFNTGIAWQGEVSYKPDAPFQVDDVELLFAALSPLDGLSPNPSLCPNNPNGAVGPLGCFNQLGPYGLNQVIEGAVELDVWQAQTTFTYLSGPLLGADTGAFVMELGMNHVPDLPSTTSGGPNGVGLRLEGPGTVVSGNAALAGSHFGEVDPRSAFPSKTSWGYRFRGALIYNNAIGPWTLSPIASYSRDVNGVSPGPGGNFIEGRTAMSLGLKGTLRNKYEVELNYAEFGGAGRFNQANDRDFISLTGKVSF